MFFARRFSFANFLMDALTFSALVVVLAAQGALRRLLAGSIRNENDEAVPVHLAIEIS